jgi:hypothetical protein
MGTALVDQFAAVLSGLMKSRADAKTAVALESLTRKKAVKVGKSTIDRAAKGQVAIGIDALESIAIALGLRPWQLLRMADESASEGGGGHKDNPAWANHSAAHRALYANILGGGHLLSERACNTLVDLMEQLASDAIVPDPDAATLPVFSERELLAPPRKSTKQRTKASVKGG